MDTPTRETSLAELLRDVLVRTEATELAEALAILEIARASDSGNIYLGALKRQLETMFTLQRSGGLNAEKKIELLETVPGIVECAVRENRRQARPPEAAASPREAERELEALKLLYFQRASKFVMKGEYEQALAEVERVFVVDPTNSIAKQYAQRVEQLIQQARKLAAAPEPVSPGEVEAVAASDDEATAQAGPSTAWTDEFLAPGAPIPEHRPAATSSKQTIAFGSSLAGSLASHTVAPDAAPVPMARRRSSRVLAVALIVLLMGGGTFAILTATGAESAGDENNALTQQSPQANLNAQAAGAMTAQQQQAVDPAGKREQPVDPAQKDEPVSPAAVPPPAVTTLVTETPQRSAPEPKSLTAKRVEPAPAETPVSAPVVEPTPAVVEAAPAETPAFVPIEKQPEILTLEKPVFSPFVWKTGGEAQVVVRVLIDTDGNPVDTQVLKSTNSIFEAPVLEAVMKSKFVPAQMGQGPVSAWLTIPFKMKQPR